MRSEADLESRVSRIKEILWELVEADEDERARILRAVREESPELADEVESLWRFDQDQASVPNQGRFAPGSRVGPFEIVEKLGSGGMGHVYLARQETPVRRRVALKVVRWGLDTAQVLVRFEGERQALAMMDHPAIAKVFDAGHTEDGRPYFVMEHVDGQPVTAYCDRTRLALPDRLRLFVRICAGVQHA
ncbi:MAG: protein kinase, partial [Candidatus Eisenbacteria bacterium]